MKFYTILFHLFSAVINELIWVFGGLKKKKTKSGYFKDRDVCVCVYILSFQVKMAHHFKT